MITRYYLTCIFLCGICITNAQEESWLRTGDSLYGKNQFFQASVAYERVLFADLDKTTRYRAVEGKIQCLKQQQLFDQAVNFIKENLNSGFDDSLQYKLSHQHLLCAYLAGRFEESLSAVEQIKYAFPSRADDRWLKGIQILSLNELQRWKEASEAYAAFMRDAELAGDTSLYKRLPRLKSVSKAGWLSTFIPGAGQWYAGKPLEALASIVIQGAGIYFGVVSFQQHYYLSAWLVGAGIFGSFHMGGVRRSEMLVNQYNRKKVQAFNEAVKTQVLEQMDHGRDNK